MTVSFFLTSEEEGRTLVSKNRLNFPVKLSAAYVPGGWHREAKSQEEFFKLLSEGIKISPIEEVRIEHSVDAKPNT